MLKELIKTKDWQELKNILNDEIVEKPIKVNTKGKTADVIALEYKAHELSAQRIKRFINRVERENQDKKDIGTLKDYR
jgi:transcriptional regulator of heat shock response